MVFKQLLQAEAIDVCQIDSVRLAGVTEVLSVLLMAAKFGVPVCPHAGGVSLCEHVIHLRLVSTLHIFRYKGIYVTLQPNRLYPRIWYHGTKCP
jgi:L-fuconate dehydratase